MSLRVLDLFSGLGAFSRGLEATGGFKTAAFCEINPFCRSELARDWPEAPIYDDIRTLSAARLAADGIAVDAICGGFPCQDLSNAGRRTGLAGKRSGLWFEYLRLIDEIRPKVVFFENVTALRRRGLDQVLGGLAEIGYDAEWHCVPAAHFGSPDLRDRIWGLAYPQHSYADGQRSHPADLHQHGSAELFDRKERVAGPVVQALPGPGTRLGSGTVGRWRPEPGVRRVVARTPLVVEQLKALGNSLKPIIPEALGLAYLAAKSSAEPMPGAWSRDEQNPYRMGEHP